LNQIEATASKCAKERLRHQFRDHAVRRYVQVMEVTEKAGQNARVTVGRDAQKQTPQTKKQSAPVGEQSH
jgi:hypothetical protein